MDRLNRRSCLPDLYFSSADNGKSWDEPVDPDQVDLSILGNVDPPILKRRDGKTVILRPGEDLEPIGDLRTRKEFPIPNAPADYYVTYRQADLSSKMFSLQRLLFRSSL